MNRWSLTLICPVLVVTACGSQPDSLLSTTWFATQINGAPVVQGTRPTLEFDEKERVSGHAGCNRYGGSVTFEGSSLKLGPLVSTRMACADPAANDQETRLLAALEAARAHRKDGTDLVLLDGQGNALARFKPE